LLFKICYLLFASFPTRLAIIGHTSLYITKRLALLDYKNNVDILDAEVKELNDLYMSNRLHRHKAVASEADDKRIIPIYEYPCLFLIIMII
jgi:hypothetical protein